MDNYLGREILAVLEDWIVVFDGKFNYLVFDCCNRQVISQYKHNRLPYNRSKYMRKDGLTGGYKSVEFYSCFDNAVENMILNYVYGGFRV